MSEQQSAVERLAEQWNTAPDHGPTEYDRGRVEQRHAMTMQLLEAIEADRAGVVAEEPGSVMKYVHASAVDAAAEAMRANQQRTQLAQLRGEKS